MSTPSEDLSQPASIPASVPPVGAGSWEDAETVQMTRPLPLEPEKISARPESLPTIGHIGRYALKQAIGDGGLGTVYAAHDPLLSRLIAIKTLNIDLPEDSRDEFNAMFLNEARAAGGLSHPYIVTVFDAGTSDHGVYIAMELLKGKDLRQLLATGWRPTPAQAGGWKAISSGAKLAPESRRRALLAGNLIVPPWVSEEAVAVAVSIMKSWTALPFHCQWLRRRTFAR